MRFYIEEDFCSLTFEDNDPNIVKKCFYLSRQHPDKEITLYANRYKCHSYAKVRMVFKNGATIVDKKFYQHVPSDDSWQWNNIANEFDNLINTN